jgi:hypothetical protein
MTPFLGLAIYVKLADPSNGSDVAPPSSPACGDRALVNVTAFPDYATPRLLTSVAIYANEDQARAAGPGNAAFWPPDSVYE